MISKDALRVLRVALLTVFTLFVFASSAGATAYVVELKSTVTTASVASAYGITTLNSYRYAFNGFSADISAAQYKKLLADVRVISVTTDDIVSIGGNFRTNSTTASSQLISTAIKRIGGLASPTAKIDGVSDAMNIDVAILDTGIEASHPDLNVVGGIDCTKSKVGYIDESGHGTQSAGFVGAMDNSFGVVGVAPGARLWAVRVLNKKGSGTRSSLLCGLDWLTSMSSTIEVANLSLVGNGSDDGNCGLTKKDLVHQAICRATNAGTTVVVAAGNDSQDAANAVPASYDEVVTVSGIADTEGAPGGLGGIDTCTGFADDVFAPFSNFGADVDISAPATCITSTYLGGGYAGGTGTSFSSPLVAGAAALYLVNHPYTSPSGVRTALIAAQEVGPISGDPDAFAEGVLKISTL